MTTKKSTGLEKQDAYLTSLHSRPLFCPHCHGMHSYIEARGGNDWGKIDGDVKCPVTGKALIHQVPLIGDNFFSVPVNDTTPFTPNRITVAPTGKPNQHEVTTHFEFEGNPSTDTHIVWDSSTCNGYCDQVTSLLREIELNDADYSYIGPKELIINGKKYFTPNVKHSDEVYP